MCGHVQALRGREGAQTLFGGFSRTSPTYTWTVYMYDNAFRIGKWLQGYASAIGWLGALGMMVVVAGLLYIFRDQDG